MATRPLHLIAGEIITDWGPKMHFDAKPVVHAMLELNAI